MANKHRLHDIEKCQESINDVYSVFTRMANMLKESDEVQDKEECLAASDRIIVGLNEMKMMLQEEHMIEELT